MSDCYPIVAGSFELDEPVGRGGVATVWRGTHRHRDVAAAVKVLSSEHACVPSAREGFRREVRAQAGLAHPGIVTVYEYGRISTEAEAASDGALEAGAPYCALEFAPAGSLRAQGRIDSWAIARAFLLEILDALSHAHARGVIHRDLKPENVLYFPGEAAGRFRLTDFGIAHAIGGEVGADTGNIDDATAGTPEYMPPEQIQGEWRVFGPWTDLYAVGCMAYEIAAGDVPFDGGSSVQVAHRQLTRQPPEMEPEFPVPDGFRAWVRCLLAKDLRDRFRRASDAAWMLSTMPSSVDDGDLRSSSGRTVDVSEGSDGSSKAQFTTERARTRQMWSVSTASRETRPPDGAAATVQFEREAPQLTTLATQTSTVPADAVGDRTREIAGDRPSLEAAFETGPPPPLPDGWQFERGERPSTHRVDAGLELFGLRSPPFVARRTGRNRIWAALEEVYEESGPRVVEISGSSGVGKTRLARWMANRVHELGAAHVLWAGHSRRGGPTEGLPAMLESEFNVWGLERSRAFRRISAEIEARYDRLQASARDLEETARALTEIIAPTSGTAPGTGARYRFSTPEERFEVVARFLEELCRERPVYAVFDDIQWGSDAARFVEYVLEQRPELPVLFVATVPSDERSKTPVAETSLRAIRGGDGHRAVELSPLKTTDIVELVHRMLPLEVETVRRVVEDARGRPLVAVQTLASWIDRDLLRGSDSGFALAAAEDELADEFGPVLEARIERAVDGLRRAGAEGGERALELAAALGPHVDLREWRAVCRRADIEPRALVYESLIRRGLARSRTQGWSFAHRQIVDRIEHRARERGRWRSHHQYCGESLSELYGEDRPRPQRRMVEHFREAGEFGRAVRSLLVCARHLADRGSSRRCRELLEEYSDVVEGAPNTPPGELEELARRCGAGWGASNRGGASVPLGGSGGSASER